MIPILWSYKRSPVITKNPNKNFILIMFSCLPFLGLLSVLTVIVSGSPNPRTPKRKPGTWDCSGVMLSTAYNIPAPKGYCGKASAYDPDDIYKIDPLEYLVVPSNINAKDSRGNSIFDCYGKDMTTKYCCGDLKLEQKPPKERFEHISRDEMPGNCINHA